YGGRRMELSAPLHLISHEGALQMMISACCSSSSRSSICTIEDEETASDPFIGDEQTTQLPQGEIPRAADWNEEDEQGHHQAADLETTPMNASCTASSSSSSSRRRSSTSSSTKLYITQ